MFKKFLEQPRNATSAPRTKESKLLICKCSTTYKKFVVRLDRKIGTPSWSMAYAFPFHESLNSDGAVAQKSERIIIGDIDVKWNGCPFCKHKATITFCSCGTVFCSDSAGCVVTCPECKQTYQTYLAHNFDAKTSSH